MSQYFHSEIEPAGGTLDLHDMTGLHLMNAVEGRRSRHHRLHQLVEQTG